MPKVIYISGIFNAASWMVHDGTDTIPLHTVWSGQSVTANDLWTGNRPAIRTWTDSDPRGVILHTGYLMSFDENGSEQLVMDQNTFANKIDTGQASAPSNTQWRHWSSSCHFVNEDGDGFVVYSVAPNGAPTGRISTFWIKEFTLNAGGLSHSPSSVMFRANGVDDAIESGFNERAADVNAILLDASLDRWFFTFTFDQSQPRYVIIDNLTNNVGRIVYMQSSVSQPKFNTLFSGGHTHGTCQQVIRYKDNKVFATGQGVSDGSSGPVELNVATVTTGGVHGRFLQGGANPVSLASLGLELTSISYMCMLDDEHILLCNFVRAVVVHFNEATETFTVVENYPFVGAVGVTQSNAQRYVRVYKVRPDEVVFFIIASGSLNIAAGVMTCSLKFDSNWQVIQTALNTTGGTKVPELANDVAQTTAGTRGPGVYPADDVIDKFYEFQGTSAANFPLFARVYKRIA